MNRLRTDPTQGYAAQVVDQVCPRTNVQPWKSWIASLALHVIAFALLAGVVLVPAVDPSRKSAFTVDVSLPDEDTNSLQILEGDHTAPADPLTDPANLPEPLPEFAPGDAIAPNATLDEQIAEAVTVASANPGMGELIQLPASVTAARLLPQTNGTGAGNVFGDGSGFAGSGKSAPLKRTPPNRTGASMRQVEDGTMVDGWMFIGLDQNENPVFVHPQDTVVWYDDDPRETNMAPKKQLWIKRFRAAGFHVEPWPFRYTYDCRRMPIGMRYGPEFPMYSANLLAAIARMRELNRSTVLAWSPFQYSASEDHPPHFRQWLEEVKAMQANGERFIVGYTLTIPSYPYRKVLGDHGQSWVRMDKFSCIIHWDVCPDSGPASPTQDFYNGQDAQEVHARFWHWMMTADKAGGLVGLDKFTGEKSPRLDDAFWEVMNNPVPLQPTTTGSQ